MIKGITLYKCVPHYKNIKTRGAKLN